MGDRTIALLCLGSLFSISPSPLQYSLTNLIVGWSTRTAQQANAGFGHASNPNIYDQSFGGGNEGASIKSKLINLISATRTLMRSELDSISHRLRGIY
jgi:hypothetical protein